MTWMMWLYVFEWVKTFHSWTFFATGKDPEACVVWTWDWKNFSGYYQHFEENQVILQKFWNQQDFCFKDSLSRWETQEKEGIRYNWLLRKVWFPRLRPPNNLFAGFYLFILPSIQPRVPLDSNVAGKASNWIGRCARFEAGPCIWKQGGDHQVLLFLCERDAYLKPSNKDKFNSAKRRCEAVCNTCLQCSVSACNKIGLHMYIRCRWMFLTNECFDLEEVLLHCRFPWSPWKCCLGGICSPSTAISISSIIYYNHNNLAATSTTIYAIPAIALIRVLPYGALIFKLVAVYSLHNRKIAC